jgi:hypothetical protein
MKGFAYLIFLWSLVPFRILRASCKMIFSPNLFVMLKILSSEYQLYVCGKIFRMPRF